MEPEQNQEELNIPQEEIAKEVEPTSEELNEVETVEPPMEGEEKDVS